MTAYLPLVCITCRQAEVRLSHYGHRDALCHYETFPLVPKIHYYYCRFSVYAKS